MRPCGFYPIPVPAEPSGQHHGADRGRTGRIAAQHPGLLPTVHLPAAAARQVEERGVLADAKISRLASAGGRHLTQRSLRSWSMTSRSGAARTTAPC